MITCSRQPQPKILETMSLTIVQLNSRATPKVGGPLVCPVQSTFGNLRDDGAIWEGTSLQVHSVLKAMSTKEQRSIGQTRTGVGTSAPVTRSTGASR